MSNYSIALFLHIVGMLGFSVALGLEWIGLSQIRGARQPGEALAILRMIKGASRPGFISMLITVVTGVYMVLTYWGWVAWVLVVIGSLILAIVLSVKLTRPRLMAIGQALTAQRGFASQTFYDLVNHPMLWISIQTRVAIVLGIILLKFTKPNLGASTVTIGIAIILGVVSAVPLSRRVRAQEEAVD